jgi:anti-anti-sigma regulatory factor
MPKNTPESSAQRVPEPSPRSRIPYHPDAVAAIEREAIRAIEAGAEPVLDLDARDEIDAGDMRIFIKLLRRCRDLGGRLALGTSRPQHLRILASTGLDKVFAMAGS